MPRLNTLNISTAQDIYADIKQTIDAELAHNEASYAIGDITKITPNAVYPHIIMVTENNYNFLYNLNTNAIIPITGYPSGVSGTADTAGAYFSVYTNYTTYIIDVNGNIGNVGYEQGYDTNSNNKIKKFTYLQYCFYVSYGRGNTYNQDSYTYPMDSSEIPSNLAANGVWSQYANSCTMNNMTNTPGLIFDVSCTLLGPTLYRKIYVLAGVDKTKPYYLVNYYNNSQGYNRSDVCLASTFVSREDVLNYVSTGGTFTVNYEEILQITDDGSDSSYNPSYNFGSLWSCFIDDRLFGVQARSSSFEGEAYFENGQQVYKIFVVSNKGDYTEIPSLQRDLTGSYDEHTAIPFKDNNGQGILVWTKYNISSTIEYHCIKAYFNPGPEYLDYASRPLDQKGIKALIDECKEYVQSKKQS